MLNRLAERYSALASRAVGPARRAVIFPRLMRIKLAQWRRVRRRDHQLSLVRMAVSSIPGHERFREMAFIFAVIGLAAKIARKEGRGQEQDLALFQRIFPMPEGEEEKVRQLFMSATEDGTDLKIYAKRICGLFPLSAHKPLLSNVFQRLKQLAGPEATISLEKRRMLHQIGRELGIKQRELNRILPLPRHVIRRSNPYHVLQIKRGATDEQIRRHYLRLIRENHPDKVQAKGGSRQSVEAASKRMAELNAAYASLTQHR